MLELNEEETQKLQMEFSAAWCTCLMDSVQEVEAQDLSTYCIGKGYKPFPKPVVDAVGTRYAYLLQDNGPKRKLVADFGDFPHFPKSSAEGLLRAIRRIAGHESSTPTKIVSALNEIKSARVVNEAAEFDLAAEVAGSAI